MPACSPFANLHDIPTSFGRQRSKTFSTNTDKWIPRLLEDTAIKYKVRRTPSKAVRNGIIYCVTYRAACKKFRFSPAFYAKYPWRSEQIRQISTVLFTAASTIIAPRVPTRLRGALLAYVRILEKQRVKRATVAQVSAGHPLYKPTWRMFTLSSKASTIDSRSIECTPT